MSKKVYLRLKSYSDDAWAQNPLGLLFRITANVAHEIRERARMQEPDEHIWLAGLKTKVADEIESTSAHRIVEEHFQAALMTLAEGQRHVLLLHANERLTYQEIAARQQRPSERVLEDLALAYSNLRIRLRGEDLGEDD